MSMTWKENEKELREMREKYPDFFEYLSLIGSSLLENNNLCINDHNCNAMAVSYVVIARHQSAKNSMFGANTENPAFWVTPWYPHTFKQTMNQLYLDDSNLVHLSVFSNGPILHRSHVQNGNVHVEGQYIYFALPIENFQSIVCKRKL